MNFKSNKTQVKAALKQAKERTLEGVGVFVDGEAVNRCPVDTGNLRGSINHIIDLDDESVTIGTPVDYAPYVEKGTYNPNYPKQPFLGPAAEDNFDRIRRLASELMKL